LREWGFADLALKFGKVVWCCDSLQFLFDLAVDPGSQTPHMYQSASPLAFARRNQGVGLSFLVTEAHFAIIFSCFYCLIMCVFIVGDLKHPISFIEVVGVSQCECFCLIFGLNHHVFHPAQLYDVSWSWIKRNLLRG
jgi:hypothetical protein